MSPKSSSEPDGHDLNTEIALFRYGLIAPLIHDPPPPGQQERRLREIAAKSYTIPASTRTRVSVTTLRRYLEAYREGGFDALRPKPRADKGVPRAFPPDVVDRAVVLREEQPARTTQTLVDILARDESLDLDRPINVHTLTTHLRQRGKTRRLLRQTPQTSRRFERSHVNDLWQGDAMHGPWLPDPDRPGKKRRTHLFCFIDDHSRLVPYAQFFFDEALPRMERVLKVGILRAQFLPELETSDIATLSDLNDALLAWIECIYHRHVHSTTKQTPLDRYTAGLEHVRPADAETIRLAFLWHETRKVRRNATIALQSNTYQVDPALAGQTIELRFDPFDLSQVDLYLGDRHLGTATVSVQNRQRHLKVERLATEPPDPPKPQSSLDFLAALRQEYHAQQQRELGPLHFSRLANPDESDGTDETDDSQED